MRRIELYVDLGGGKNLGTHVELEDGFADVRTQTLFIDREDFELFYQMVDSMDNRLLALSAEEKELPAEKTGVVAAPPTSGFHSKVEMI